MNSPARAAVFLDRDGVLVEEICRPQTGKLQAPLRAEDVRLLPQAAAALRRLKHLGYALVLVSNQAAYAKGQTTLRNLWLVHQRFVDLLLAEQVRLDGVYYAYAHPNGVMPFFSGPAINRKPSPYSLFVAAAELDLDLDRSWLIGDQESDIACAQAAGVRAILVRSQRPIDTLRRDVVEVDNIEEASRLICAEAGASKA